ncbi:MAG: hypothetical protein IJF40_02810 [Clostridia bacterium]|nr:hypothetical protein [Clostridia bacterium]
MSDTMDNKQPIPEENAENIQTPEENTDNVEILAEEAAEQSENIETADGDISEDDNSSSLEYDPAKCVVCQKNLREEGSYYCSECRTEMLKTKLKSGSIFAAVLSAVLSLAALVILSFNAAQILPLIEADILVKDGYVNAAMNSVSQAEETTNGINNISFISTLSELFNGQEFFTLGNAADITTAKIYAKGYTEVDAGGYLVQQVGEDEVMSNPLFLSVRKYVKEYNLYNNTQKAVYDYFSAYESLDSQEFPYEETIKKINSHKNKDGIGNHYLEHYKCYAAILADKGYEVQNEYLLEMEKLYPSGILIYGALLADNYYQMGKYDKAIEYADKMLAQNRNYSPAYELKFTSYLATDDFKNAEKVCDDIAQTNNKAGTDNGDYTEYSLRARLLWEQGDYEKALVTCEEGIEISGGDAEIYRQQAIVYLLRKDYKKAVESANNAYQFAYYSSTLDLQTLNTAALCAGLAKDDELYETMESTLQSYGYEISTLVTDCIAGKITVEEVFSSVGGDVL